MGSTQHPDFEENFLLKPSKVDDLFKFLDEIAKANKMEKKKDEKVEVDLSAGVTETNFLVMERCPLGLKKPSFKKTSVVSNLNQMTFMRQIDMTSDQRNTARIERVRVANNYRRLGNAEFRKPNYEKAIEMYSKGLQYISDTEVLYLNRALCYVKKREYKRAIIDIDFVLYHLDFHSLRGWLYKAGTLKRMNNEAGYKECADNARRFNREFVGFVDKFLEKMRTDF
ncbi:hypothetical protein AWZ03_004697 [Drosophila navojoa]|uniref:Uncharacterized protein n=1 Tax=Drosophila navojoa TaxID=7232 RepID=A0A484BJG3_DRONA|nr:tetratricopeptide repeat protein 12-like [Drosophila navojoa]TDG48794.1 hypothetical protein AWZ03_004697 [Drosophila navojoa]